jgi:methylamine dehydrogenase accessory protein MauD
MDIALLAARLLLAAVFLVAGLAKLVDTVGSQQALIGFGVPAVVATPLGRLLPLAEMAVAIALIPAVSAWWGALGALLLLMLFGAGISMSLARGRNPDCHCFGQLHSGPVGWSTLLRNGLLAVVALFIIWQGQGNPGPSAVGWVAGLTTVERIGVVGGLSTLGLLGAMCWLLVQVLSQQGRLLLRLDTLEARLAGGMAPTDNGAPGGPQGLPVGTLAPEFELPDLEGQKHTLAALRAPGKPVVLLFVAPNCGPCNALLPDISRWQVEHAEQLTVALISRGDRGPNRAKATEHGTTLVLLQDDYEVALAYQAYGTPSGVLVRPDGTIGSPVAPGADAIKGLVAQALGKPAPIPLLMVPHAHGHNGHAHPPARPASPAIGTLAPKLELPDLTGKPVRLEDFRGTKTLVLFWNPGCGFCQQMLPDLSAWEANPPKGAPKLLVVSAGTVETNQAQHFLSPVVLDPNFSVGHAFGASGTPSAILVDTEGRIASELAVGAPGVLALAGARAATA